MRLFLFHDAICVASRVRWADRGEDIASPFVTNAAPGEPGTDTIPMQPSAVLTVRTLQFVLRQPAGSFARIIA